MPFHHPPVGPPAQRPLQARCLDVAYAENVPADRPCLSTGGLLHLSTEALAGRPGRRTTSETAGNAPDQCCARPHGGARWRRTAPAEAVVAAFHICLGGIVLLLVVGLAPDIREHRRGRTVEGATWARRRVGPGWRTGSAARTGPSAAREPRSPGERPGRDAPAEGPVTREDAGGQPERMACRVGEHPTLLHVRLDAVPGGSSCEHRCLGRCQVV
jgi:hypothetical protein